MRCCYGKRFDVAAFEAEFVQQRMHCELRMIQCGRGNLAVRVRGAADLAGYRSIGNSSPLEIIRVIQELDR